MKNIEVISTKTSKKIEQVFDSNIFANVMARYGLSSNYYKSVGWSAGLNGADALIAGSLDAYADVFAVAPLGVVAKTYCIPLFMIAPFFSCDKLMHLDSLGGITLKITCESNAIALATDQGAGTSYTVTNAQVVARMVYPHASFVEDYRNQVKRKGVNIYYRSVWTQQDAIEANMRRMVNCSLGNAISVLQVGREAGDEVRGQYSFQFTQNSGVDEVGYQYGSQLFPSDGVLSNTSRMFTEVRRAIGHLSNVYSSCTVGPLSYSATAGVATSRNFVVGYELEKSESGIENGLSLNLTQIQYRYKLTGAATAGTLYTFLIHEKKLTISEGGLAVLE
jgi:hypothetical protein